VATTSFDLVTPTATLFSGQAEMIVCKSVEGEIAFLADHEAYIGALDPCLVRVVGPEGDTAGGGGEFRAAVRGGFVEVQDNHVIMLADLAVLPSDIDVPEAEADQSDAESRVASSPAGEPAREEADNDLKWASARLEAARS
jgi:F-type H+-transporting ATPase subunit epsilon